MKKKVIRTVLGVFFVIVCSIGYLVYSLFFSLSNLPKGTFLTEAVSPTGEYSIRAYQVNGGATTSWAVRGELINQKTGYKENIYWDYRIDSAVIVWLDQETVVINGHELNIKRDVYDWRRT